MLSFLKLKEELDRQNFPSQTPALENQYYEQIIRMVKIYVAEHLRNATLEEAAVKAHLSSSYLSRLFKTECHISFSEYVLQKRMEHACLLLNNPRNKIYEISDAIGYDNPKNFSRAFKNYYNLSPKEFREKRG